MKYLLGMMSLLVLHAAQQWYPAELDDRSTIEFLTIGPDEGEHWSTVWFS